MQKCKDDAILKASAEEMAAIIKATKKKGFRSFVLRKVMLVAIALALTLVVGLVYYTFDSSVPSVINIVADEEQAIELGVPASGEIVSVNSKGRASVPTQAGAINLNKALTMKLPAESSCSLQVRLFGIIPMKQVGVNSIDNIRLLPAGIPIGLYIETDGILVVGTGSFTDKTGTTVSPAENVLYAGDYLRTVDGKRIDSKEDFVVCVNSGGGREMALTILRDDKELSVTLSPKQDATGNYKAGIWVKDDAQGVGTLTYIDENGNFGALGHGIADVDSQSVMNLDSGTLFDSKIVGIKKGMAGDPGEMTGTIIYGSNHMIGEITENSDRGIYGRYTGDISAVSKGQFMDIGLKQEIKKGPAQILCTVEKEPEYFDVEITAIHLEYDRVNRGIELKVTDKRLLETTGGIVQGMSGSPIIQNGKIIGAVTHVLVNDPTKGYGIFIENMLQK